MIKISDLSVGQRVALELLWGFTWCISVMPYWFKFYVLEPVLYCVLAKLLRYRRGVIVENLRSSFPEKSDEDLSHIIRGFYHNLAEVMIGTFNLVHFPDKKIRRYFRMRDFEALKREMPDEDIIVLFAHHGLWELGAFWTMEDPTHESLGIYHELRSKVLDLFYQRLRSTPYSTPVQKKESMRFLLLHRKDGVRGRKMAMGLIADQHPNIPVNADTHWFRFLNHDTVFFDGGEQLATRYHMPVYFAPMFRVGRGRYEMSFEMIYDGYEEVAKHEITERYVQRLEQMITEAPELWMWSHRRWKHKRNAEN